MASFLILLSLFTIPLMVPDIGLGYEQIKVLTFLFLTSLISIFWLYLHLKEPKKYQIKPNKLKLTALFFILILSITSAVGVDLLNSILGSPPYFQGLITYAYLFLFTLMISVFKPNILDISKSLTLSSLLVSVLALKDFFLVTFLKIDVPNYAGRVVSTFGQPNFYAGFLLICLPFIYFLVFDHRYTSGVARLKLLDTPGVYIQGWKILAIISCLLSVAAIGISGSRSSQIILFIATFLVLFGYIKSKLKYLLFLAVLVIFFWAIYTSYVQKSGIILNEYYKPLQNEQWISWNSPERRIFIWPVISQVILERPFFGYGLDSLRIIWPKYFERFAPELGQMSPTNLTLKNLLIDRSHNYLLDLLLFSGTLGMLGWLGLIGVLIKYLFPLNANRQPLIASLLLYLTFIQLQNQSIVHLIQFWLLVGLIDTNP